MASKIGTAWGHFSGHFQVATAWGRLGGGALLRQHRLRWMWHIIWHGSHLLASNQLKTPSTGPATVWNFLRWLLWRWIQNTLQGTNISPKNGILKMIFLFPRWDMLIPWRVSVFYYGIQWCSLTANMLIKAYDCFEKAIHLFKMTIPSSNSNQLQTRSEKKRTL